MPNFCAVLGCSNRVTKGVTRSFYRLPSVVGHQGETTLLLSTKRREGWLQALRRKNLNLKQTLVPYSYDQYRICSDHFVTGMPAPLYDVSNPDWIPSVNMGHGTARSQTGRQKKHSRSRASRKGHGDVEMSQDEPLEGTGGLETAAHSDVHQDDEQCEAQVKDETEEIHVQDQQVKKEETEAIHIEVKKEETEEMHIQAAQQQATLPFCEIQSVVVKEEFETTSTSENDQADALVMETEEVTPVNAGTCQESSLIFQLTPNQPQQTFPRKKFGLRERNFKSAWYKLYPWLEYDGALDKAFCHPCRICDHLNLFTASKNRDPAFVSHGVNNWSKATVRFSSHEKTHAHSEAVRKLTRYCDSETTKAAQERRVSDSKKALLSIILSLRFLARQGLASGEHNDTDSNFYQLLNLHATDSTELSGWLQMRQDWLVRDIENEMLDIMSNTVLQDIAKQVKENEYFSLIVDESSDVSNKEHVSILLRHVDENFDVHEDFVGLCTTANADAATLTSVIKDLLLTLGLSLDGCRGQCYDGANAMSGIFSGVQASIAAEQPKAFNVHCTAHCLNLVLQEATRSVPLVRDVIDFVHEITTFVNESPKYPAVLTSLQDGEQPTSVRPLCPTRRTMRTSAITAILQNYNELCQALQLMADNETGTAGSTAAGLVEQLNNFKTVFGLKACLEVFARSEEVSKCLQSSKLTVSESKTITDTLRCSFSHLRTENAFLALWKECNEMAAKLDIEEPHAPHPRKMPRRADVGEDHVQPEPSKVEELYKVKHWHPLIDVLIKAMDGRFESGGASVAASVEQLLFKSAQRKECTEELAIVQKHYATDIDMERLKVQLSMFPDALSGKVTFATMVEAMRKMGGASALFSEVKTLLKILTVLPSSSAEDESSSSGLRRLNAYLCSSVSHQRLNHIVLHVHQERTDKLDLQRIANKFVCRTSERRSAFGWCNYRGTVAQSVPLPPRS